jgi:hypothetical protein
MRDEVGRLLEFFWRSTRGFAPDGGRSPHDDHPTLPEEGRHPGTAV